MVGNIGVLLLLQLCRENREQYEMEKKLSCMKVLFLDFEMEIPDASSKIR